MASRRDVDKQREWSQRLARQRVSGLTVARFCARERVSVHTFYYWSKRVGRGSTATELHCEPADHAHVADGTAPSGLVRFRFNAAVEISVPADCLDAIRCLAQCVQHSQAECSGAFQEVVARR
jgi:hypothetical protein